jgi:hypothetical protein
VRGREADTLAPVLMWSVFFAGATYAHIHLNTANGRRKDIVLVGDGGYSRAAAPSFR